ncbi:MAG: HesA/MoeB/ThiF family protein [Desulfobacteraceae bacterium]|nr:MAG: HesA/MoeB/ThiF family protein [Desulfobacteraceae bacterium]
MTTVSSEEAIRYGRQISLPEIGSHGQFKLKQARVFIAGIGGLGSVSAYYLAAAGIGSIRIADMDSVEAENLNRQILHGTGDIGRPKTLSAREKLRNLNPYCDVEPIQETITNENILDMIEGCDVILDGTDNLNTRKIINRASILKNIPFIYAGVHGFTGMVATFIPGHTPCLECLFSGDAGQKGPIGTIGPVPGIAASIQSLEAIKFILGTGGLLKEKLLYFNGTDMTFRKIAMEKNPDCRACGSNADIGLFTHPSKKTLK